MFMPATPAAAPGSRAFILRAARAGAIESEGWILPGKRLAAEGLAAAPKGPAFMTGAEGEGYLAKMFPGGMPQVKFETDVGKGATRFRYVDWLCSKIAR